MAKDSKIEYGHKHQTYIPSRAYTSTERKLKITITQNRGVARSHARAARERRRESARGGKERERLQGSRLRTADVFRWWLLYLPPKIASAISSCETISVTLFLFFCPHPIKLIDRKMWLITPTKSRGPQLLMQLYVSGETPKIVSSAKGDWLFFFFCLRVKFPVWRRKWRSLARVNLRFVR